MRCRSVLVAVATAALAAATIAPAVASSQGDASSWTRQSNPSAPPFGRLSGVSCPTSTFCAAVGAYSAATTGEGEKAEAWIRPSDGRWHTTTVTGNLGYQLRAVSCVSATFCLAVTEPRADGLSVGFRWNGSIWSPTGPLTTESGDRVGGVSCASATWCLAVGTHSVPEQQLAQSRVWRYNGTAWATGSRPTIAGDALYGLSGVSCRSTSFCLAAGDWSYGGRSHPWVGHFNGKVWFGSGPKVPSSSTSADLSGISCPSTAECAVVGKRTVVSSDDSVTSYPYAARLTGGVWTNESVPGLASTEARPVLNSVSCAADGRCSAVGTDLLTNLGSPALVVSRTSSGWTRDDVPQAASASVAANAVSCPASSASTPSCVAVGDIETQGPFREGEYILSR